MDQPPENKYEFSKKSSISGVKWTGFAEILIRLFQFAVTIVLARLLTPTEFGQIALALVIIKLIQVFIDFGIAPALIQKQEVTEKDYQFAFTSLGILSFLLATGLFFQPHFFATLIGSGQISPLIKVLSLVIPLSAVNILPRVMLNRRLDFKGLALAESVGMLGYGALTLLFAFLWRNVWCFVVGIFAEQIFVGIYLWLKVRWRPRFHLSWAVFRDIFHFSSAVFGTRFFNFLNLNLMNVFINKFFGSSALGLYSLSFQIIDLPTQRFAKNIRKVMYPILSRLQSDLEDYRIFYLNYKLIILLVTLPFFVLLFLFAGPFVRLFYGEKWLAAIPYLKILSLVGLVRALWTGISLVSMTLGRPRFEMLLNLLISLFLFPGILLFSRLGMSAVVLWYAGLLSAVFLFGEWTVFRWLEVPLPVVMRFFRVPVIATALIAAALGLIFSFHWVPLSERFTWQFLFYASGAGVVYLLLLYWLDRESVQKLVKSLLRS